MNSQKRCSQGSQVCKCCKYSAQLIVQKYIAIPQGPVARILVSANRWLRGIKTYRFPWYLTPVSDNHASNNPGLVAPVILSDSHTRLNGIWEVGDAMVTESLKKVFFTFISISPYHNKITQLPETMFSGLTSLQLLFHINCRTIIYHSLVTFRDSFELVNK